MSSNHKFLTVHEKKKLKKGEFHFDSYNNYKHVSAKFVEKIGYWYQWVKKADLMGSLASTDASSSLGHLSHCFFVYGLNI